MIKIKKMNRRDTIALALLIALAVVLGLVILLYGSNFAVLNPKGLLAEREKRLIVFATLLSLVVIVPVYIMAFGIAFKYQESNKRAKYTPDWDHNAALETTWWLIPSIIIGILSIVAWTSSQALDPFKPLVSNTKPVTIQVVALQWKWLFIYPQQNVASINYVDLPVNTPVTFQITADAPMNSFWIPQLSGQIYAMSSMLTELHLMSNTLGSYNGFSANISGAGFASMRFTANVVTSGDFTDWLSQANQSHNNLNLASYNKLASPGVGNYPKQIYSSVQSNLFKYVLTKFDEPALAPVSEQPAAVPQGVNQ